MSEIVQTSKKAVVIIPFVIGISCFAFGFAILFIYAVAGIVMALGEILTNIPSLELWEWGTALFFIGSMLIVTADILQNLLSS